MHYIKIMLKQAMKSCTFDHDMRLKIVAPDLDIIDESYLTLSSLDVSRMVESVTNSSLQENRNESRMEKSVVIPQFGESSKDVTEIYNVQQLISNCYNSKDSPPIENQVTQITSPPTTPILDLPSYPSRRTFLVNKPIHTQSPHFQNSIQESIDTLKNSANASVSKIPVRKQNLFLETSDDGHNRRKTYCVVPQCKDKEQNSILLSERLETFTIKEKIIELSPKNMSKIENQGSFIIPSVQHSSSFLKHGVNLNPTSLIFNPTLLDTYSDDKTVIISEDMELTEIIPSSVSMQNALLKDQNNSHVVSSKENEMPHILPTVLEIDKKISPIAKINSKSHTKRNNSKLESFNSENSLSAKDKTPPKTDQIIELGYLSSCTEKSIPTSLENPIASKQSLLPAKSPLGNNSNVDYNSEATLKNINARSSKKSSNQQILITDNVQTVTLISENIGEVSDKKTNSRSSKKSSQLQVFSNTSSNFLYNTNLIKTAVTSDNQMSNTEHSTCVVKSPVEINDPSKKSISNSNRPKNSIIEKNSESNTLSLQSTSDTDTDFVEPNIPQNKRIPGRKSIKPNRRGPYIFKNYKSKESNLKQVGSLGDKSKSTDNKGKSYDFSSSESEEEVCDKQKKVKRKLKKYSKGSKLRNESSTVSVLERDINQLYQDQSRKKRSLNRKVSFAPVLTPTNSDAESDCKSNDIDKINSNLMISANTVKISDNLTSIIAKSQAVEINAPRRPSILKKTRQSISAYDKPSSLLPEKLHPVNEDHEKYNKKSNFQTLTLGNFSNENNKVESNMDSAFTVKSKNIDKKSISIDENNVESLDHVEEKKLSGVLNETVSDSLCFVALPNDHKDKKDKSNPTCESIKNIQPKKKSHKLSDSLGQENKLSTRSRSRTFSSISERNSKKRFTANDDFLEDVDVGLPNDFLTNNVVLTEETFQKPEDFKKTHKKSDCSGLENKPSTSCGGRTLSSISEHNSKKLFTANDSLKDVDFILSNKILTDVVFPEEKKTKRSQKPEDLKKSNLSSNPDDLLLNKFEDKIEKNTKPSSNLKKSSNKSGKRKNEKQSTEVKTLSEYNSCQSKSKLSEKNMMGVDLPAPSKVRKTTSTDSTTSEKENVVVPDLECDRRSRRTRAIISFKEPSLNRKMRR